ncbi:TPA: hypothetical protein O4569_000890 [Staphylococcus aureus]|nr:hypothetical protein [Staphylococcus aureus]HDA2455461.1 hypothetical protein [Staphylococcus aureus]
MKKIYGDRIFHSHFLKEQEVKNWKTVNQIIEKEHLDKMNMKPSHRCSSFRDRWIRFGCTV